MIVLDEEAVAQVSQLLKDSANTRAQVPLQPTPVGPNHVPLTKWVRVSNTTPVTVSGASYYHGYTCWYDVGTATWHDVDAIWVTEPGGTTLTSTSTHYLAQYIGPQGGSGDGSAVWAVVIGGGTTLTTEYDDTTDASTPSFLEFAKNDFVITNVDATHTKLQTAGYTGTISGLLVTSVTCSGGVVSGTTKTLTLTFRDGLLTSGSLV